MKKLFLLLSISFISVVILISLFSAIDNTYSKIENNSFSKNTKNHEIKIQHNMIDVKKISKTKEGFVLYATWPWLPLNQFKGYKKFFMSGISYDETYSSLLENNP